VSPAEIAVAIMAQITDELHEATEIEAAGERSAARPAATAAS